jgi:hypothetical protein
MCPCHRGSKRRPYLPLLSALLACPGMFTLWLFIALHGVCMLQPCLTLAVHPARASSRVSFMPSAWAPSIIWHEQEVRRWMGLQHGAFGKPVLPATESVEAISGHAATVSRSQEHHMHLHVQHASHHWSTLSCTRALLNALHIGSQPPAALYAPKCVTAQHTRMHRRCTLLTAGIRTVGYA